MNPVRFKSGLNVDVLNGSQVFMLSDSDQVLMENAAVAQVVKAVDGKRDVAGIVAAVSHQIGPAVAFAAVNTMLQKGYLRSDALTGGSFGSYLENRGLDSARTIASLASAHVALLPLTLDRPSDEVTDVLVEISSGLQTQGVTVECVANHVEASALAPGASVVVVSEDYIHPNLARINQSFHQQKISWLMVKPWGQSVWMGPAFTPERSACWTCMENRLVANRQAERYLAEHLGRLPAVPTSGILPGAARIAAQAILAHLIATANNEESPFNEVLRSMDLMTMSVTDHAVIKQPLCTMCGAMKQRPTAEVVLQPTKSMEGTDGGYRVCTPEETVERLSKHISPITGAVSKIESLGVDTDGVTYSFSAGHNYATINDSMRLLAQNLRGQSGGKGRTRQQAKASAVCEAIERFSGVWDERVPVVRRAWNDLDQRAVHPGDVLLFSDSQYESRASLTRFENKFHRIPLRLDESREIDFTPGRSLTTKEEVLIPAGLAWYGTPDLSEHPYVYTDSNGEAAGNTLEEAILQGLCEVCERDAVGIWWFNRIQRPGVDLDSFGDPYIDVLREFYEKKGRDLWVVSLKNDLEMPVFAAMSKRNHDIQDIMIGFGAHPDPSLALFRALTELNQFLPFVVMRDDDGNTIYRTEDEATLEWCKNATTESEQWLLPHPELPAVRLDDLPGTGTRQIDVLVQRQVDILERVGVETIVVNQTRPEIELAVAKVFTPGLRHFWRRSAPGRLYDVPVKLGWIDRPLREDQLNTRSVFF
ncbi:MAG: TOMM precursor leader peptide-binding protein [Arachnia propionica]|nr:TOMM precursor leader peptide-binding protein [Arachnia propionica]